MSAKTKIVVLHMKELIYTGLFCLLGVLFILLLILFLPGRGKSSSGADTPTATPQAAVYIPGIYTTELVLGNQTIDVEVIVEETAITSIRLVNLNDAVTTMYPLLKPTLDSLCSQIYDSQSLDGLSYTSDSKYTSLVLLEAIQSSLKKAAVER